MSYSLLQINKKCTLKDIEHKFLSHQGNINLRMSCKTVRHNTECNQFRNLYSKNLVLCAICWIWHQGHCLLVSSCWTVSVAFLINAVISVCWVTFSTLIIICAYITSFYTRYTNSLFQT